jgi:hypothetical protein
VTLRVVLSAFALPACFTVYHPLIGFQEPTAIAPDLRNFEGDRIHIRCLPGDFVKSSEADRLCRHVELLFDNQGASVTVDTTPRAPESPADLYVELRARRLHQADSVANWTAFIFTGTLVPIVSEHTMAQDVIIRDRDGFLLAKDSWHARFLYYSGAGIWGVNWILDVLVRDKGERLTNSEPERQFSEDYYRQLSQITFNARARQNVMRATLPGVPQ